MHRFGNGRLKRVAGLERAEIILQIMERSENIYENA